MLPCFNTAGPCVPGKHYLLSPERRFARVMQLVDEEKYFTLHAGRQTGKTTAARWLADHYNSKGDRYCGLWIDVQTAREVRDTAHAMRLVLRAADWSVGLCLPQLSRPGEDQLEDWLRTPEQALLFYLVELSRAAPRPLVVLFDEADGLVGPAMVSFLTQLRGGYIARSSQPFPHSLALIGMRQVRDYVISADDRQSVAWLGTTSPFNITAEAATLAAFTKEDVAELLGQHTEATSQAFAPEAVDRIFHLSEGHPWLVNALADQMVNRDVVDRSVTVTVAHVDSAKETIIRERRTHIDSLLARLREPRVRKIIEPMLTGSVTGEDVLDDDFSYVLGLGLIAERTGRYEIANPIYKEVIPRALTHLRQKQIFHEPAWYVRDDGSLDVLKLMQAWQKFWRQDGHLAAEGFHYREAGPHLMLMAFLQRIINSGGRVEREYGLGRGALDLLLCWGQERHVVEIKLRRDTETEEEALDQIIRYLDTIGLREGWLLLFDLRKSLSWQDKLFLRDEQIEGKTVHVVGC